MRRLARGSRVRRLARGSRVRRLAREESRGGGWLEKNQGEEVG